MNTGKTSTQWMPDWLQELALGKGHPISSSSAVPTSGAGFAGPFWVGFLFREIVADVTEIRFETSVDEVSVLDGYCSATGKSRTDVMRSLLKDWSCSKLREATLICRVAGVNPTLPDAKRSEYGT